MKLQRFDSSHYEHLTGWWKTHGHPIISKHSLSPVGLVCLSDDGKPLAASFLYVMHGCDLGQIAWTTANPDAGLKERYEAVDMVLTGLFDVAKQENRTNVICFSSSSGLTKKLVKHGFNAGKSHDLLAGYFSKDL